MVIFGVSWDVEKCLSVAASLVGLGVETLEGAKKQLVGQLLSCGASFIM